MYWLLIFYYCYFRSTQTVYVVWRTVCTSIMWFMQYRQIDPIKSQNFLKNLPQSCTRKQNGRTGLVCYLVFLSFLIFTGLSIMLFWKMINNFQWFTRSLACSPSHSFIHSLTHLLSCNSLVYFLLNCCDGCMILLVALPFIKMPEENPLFAVYFTRTWQDTFLLSLYNFLNNIIHYMRILFANF